MKYFLAAVSFLTVFPCKCPAQDWNNLFAGAVAFFPVVGVLIGLICAGVGMLLVKLFPIHVTACLLVGLLALCHGGLHLDGLADTADGFLAPATRERVLEIMRDSRIGAFGCLALIGTVALKIAALSELNPSRAPWAAALAPVSGRCFLTQMLVFLPPAKADGLGKTFACRGRWTLAVWSAIVLLLVAWLTFRHAGITACIVTGLVVFGFGIACLRRIGGFTGDTLGATSELAEAAVLLALSARMMG